MQDLFIKAATVIAVALATFSSFPSPAQQEPAQQHPAQQQDQQTQQAPAAPAPAGQSQQNAIDARRSATAADLKPVTGELVSDLDSKSAKQGDSVVVKTREDLKFAGGADIPKGSKLVGRVTNVQARGDGKENSQIAIQFDTAELKGGRTLAIESVIQSVTPATGSGTDNSVPSANGLNPAPPSTPSSSPGMNGSNGSMNQSNDRPGLNNERAGSASNTTTQPGTTDQSGMPAPAALWRATGMLRFAPRQSREFCWRTTSMGCPFRTHPDCSSAHGGTFISMKGPAWLSQ